MNRNVMIRMLSLACFCYSGGFCCDVTMPTACEPCVQEMETVVDKDADVFRCSACSCKLVPDECLCLDCSCEPCDCCEEEGPCGNCCLPCAPCVPCGEENNDLDYFNDDGTFRCSVCSCELVLGECLCLDCSCEPCDSCCCCFPCATSLDYCDCSGYETCPSCGKEVAEHYYNVPPAFCIKPELYESNAYEVVPKRIIDNLLYACHEYDIEKIRFFFELGVDPNQSCCYLDKDCCVSRGYQCLEHVILGCNQKNKALCEEIIQLFLDYGLEPDEVPVDERNAPLLHLAIGNACTIQDDSLVRLLLKYGANPNVARVRVVRCQSCCWHCMDETPLHVAIKYIDSSIVRLLLEHGADPNIKNYVGDTPLHYAATYADSLEYCCSSFEETILIVRLLCAYGADVNIMNESG